MIFVERPAVDAAVAEALSAVVRGKSELQRARDFYSQVPAPTKAYDFSSYRKHEVCVALDGVFKEKCAYCETKYAAADVRNIEHFRPKGGVSESPAHPGYWWLASDWSNLLPSCPACNQRRYQVLFNDGMTLEEFDIAYVSEPTELLGKGNSFPMRPPSAWSNSESGSIAAEDPLLIEPTLLDPENHLEWVFDWDRNIALWNADVLASLRPRIQGGLEDPYGKASIAIYGLNRSGLVRDRMGHLKLLQAASSDVVFMLSQIALLPTEYHGALKDRLLIHKDRLYSYSAPVAQYSGMARAYLRCFEQELAHIADS
jgi:hypothetical protein